ncbi:MAG: hypothetical protein PHY48_00330 [Candidatus Cloacimonetes bacterium]|nr:hypothetical protein [Candidatus Cloacimonadota bacterium]
MKVYLCILLLAITVSLFGAWDWAYSIGGNSMERIWDINCDEESNVFAVGDFSDSLWVNHQTYSGFGLSDSFIIKYSASGDVLWVQTFGSPSEDVALSVATDALGNSYVSGYFVDTLTCQNISVVSNGMWDVYVAKFDPQGNLLWLRSFGGTMNDIGYGLAASPSGRVYVAGWFAGSIALPNSSTISSAGGSDVFCCALDTDGNYLWARRGGTEGVEYGYEVACDDAGNAYVTGVASLGSEFGAFSLSANGMFVCKYNPDGIEQWLSPSSGAAVIDIAVQPDANNNQYGMVCGRLTGSGSIGNFAYSTMGADDAYWAKFDANTGNWIDIQSYGGALSDKGKDVDCEDYPVFLASFEGATLFGSFSFSSNGESDIALGFGTGQMSFVAAGGENSEIPSSVKTLPNGKIAIAGWHFGLTNLGIYTLDTGNVANLNAFIACYSPQSSTDDLLSKPNAITLNPNPFHNNLTISIDKSALPIQTLDIYNIKGQKVRSLSSEDVRDNQCIYYWNGQDMLGKTCSAGVYLLKAGSSIHRAVKMN